MLNDIYYKLDNKYKPITNEKYASLVNFASNKEIPVHNWFIIKEGYSQTRNHFNNRFNKI